MSNSTGKVAKRKDIKPKPNSFWVTWYECRPSVIQFDNSGDYFFALGQDALWHVDNAELIKEIEVFAIAGINA
jgi:hypothetical protein